ncbi:hypothetical protein [Ferrovibrio sp.]|uniref:hypothetical protein n=1 Tax=Ferrovibrio sp. TaxID=1917215 RepID=UPI00262C0910|nr:hypothetical protein [Ferrovibrio sp.]
MLIAAFVILAVLGFFGWGAALARFLIGAVTLPAVLLWRLIRLAVGGAVLVLLVSASPGIAGDLRLERQPGTPGNIRVYEDGILRGVARPEQGGSYRFDRQPDRLILPGSIYDPKSSNYRREAWPKGDPRTPALPKYGR